MDTTNLTPDRADVLVMQKMIDTMVGIPKFSYPARSKNGPKPADEFAHVRVIEEYQVGIPTIVPKPSSFDTTIQQVMSCVKLRYRIGVVDTNGVPSQMVMNGWTSEPMKKIMMETGYGFLRCTPISSEDEKLEREWEYRMGFSVEMYTTRVYEQVVDNLTNTTISSSFVTQAGVAEEGSLNT